LSQRADQRAHIRELPARDARAQCGEDALGRLHSHVRADEARLELLEYGGVDVAPREEVGEVVAEPGGAAVQASAQPGDEARTLVGARCSLPGCAFEHGAGIVAGNAVGGPNGPPPQGFPTWCATGRARSPKPAAACRR